MARFSNIFLTSDLDLGHGTSGRGTSGHKQPLYQVWTSNLPPLQCYGVDNKSGMNRETDRYCDSLSQCNPKTLFGEGKIMKIDNVKNVKLNLHLRYDKEK